MAIPKFLPAQRLGCLPKRAPRHWDSIGGEYAPGPGEAFASSGRTADLVPIVLLSKMIFGSLGVYSPGPGASSCMALNREDIPKRHRGEDLLQQPFGVYSPGPGACSACMRKILEAPNFTAGPPWPSPYTSATW
eukprot:CAMPEP_0169280464 /NCGR_PEP_ID=MMETSP1016-20121227/55625_1 /TAXON_ID=342587 /ORGANISM="Karlodinium micrum, Strain CCMP2283" /LENGTH=133 /DNA_ID=CAMNT_0009368799 /DNA_START=398 /DNA_END=802 /DNA_ORIENTATION=+